MNEQYSMPLSIQQIQKRVAEHFKISVEDMKSDRRPRYIVRPRQVAMHLAVQLTHKSYPVIGHCFNKDHTTVMYANTEIPSLMVQDLKLDESVRFLKKELADIDTTGGELSVELAIDQLVSSVTAKLRANLKRLANSDPMALIETLKKNRPSQAGAQLMTRRGWFRSVLHPVIQQVRWLKTLWITRKWRNA